MIFDKDLYHISKRNHDGKTFYPRIPENEYVRDKIENDSIKRVCFSTNVNGAIMAINSYCGDLFYIHIPVDMVYMESVVDNDMLINENLTPDAKFTGEVWVTTPVKLLCIGEVVVLEHTDKRYEFFVGREKHTLIEKSYDVTLYDFAKNYNLSCV